MRLIAFVLAFCLAVLPVSAQIPVKQTFQRLRTTSNTTTTQANTEIIAGSKGFLVRRVHVTLTTAVATVILIGRSAALGTTPTTPIGLWLMGQVSDVMATSLATWALAWGTPPGNPGQTWDRATFPATIGTTREFKYDPGGWIPPGGSFVIVNVGTVGVMDITVQIEE